MVEQSTPVFRHLSARDSRSLLRRHRVGRIGFTFRDRVDIEPISFVASGNWLYARTGPGTKLRQLRHNPWVAFQVDEVDGPFDWRSVVVHGTAYFLEANGGEDYRRALRILRRLDRRILTDADPVPERRVVFRVHIHEITGRAAST
jgi:nitroimidazol reductase NimA-like FMN-containing flavoprotein (pyridoxamine 5'-phosphate oxidase superfamily)